MPTYTIAGKRITSSEPLSDEELESLYDELAGARPAAKPAAPAPAERKSRFPELPRDVRTPTDVSPGRGASGLLGIPGGLLEMATGISGVFGENEATRKLREMEKRLAAQAPEKKSYEFGKVVPQVIPALGAAKAVSKIPVASQTARALLQAAGQAGQAAVVTPSAVEGEEDRGMFGLGPRETAALLEGTIGLAGEAAVPLARRGVDFAKSAREAFSGRIRGVPTTPVTEEEKAALAIAKGRDVTPDESGLAMAEKTAAERRAELDRIKTAEAEANVIRERQRQALVAQKKAAEEAQAKALETVELTPTRGKQELGQRLRDVVTSARQKYMDARNQAIGKFESGDEIPVFTAAKEMEAQDQFINSTDQFKGLVKFLRERGTGKLGKQELIAEERRAFAKALKEITPTQRVVEEVVDEAGNVAKTEKLVPLPITFEKLVKLRRRIAGQDPGVAETGFEAIKGKTRENILKKIDDALEGFSPGYLDYKKAYAEASEPLDFLKVNSVGKKAATFQKFSQEEFQANPESVLDALLNNPSKTNADNLLKFVGNENKDEIEQVVLEALVNKAGGKSSGYTKVLEKYDDFLGAFPTAKTRLQEEAGVFEKVTAPARAEFEKATAGLEGLKGERAAAANRVRIANAEFKKADAIRIAANERVKALNQLDEDTLIAVSEAANQVPLGTSLGLAKAVALGTMAAGAGALLNESPILGILGIAGGALGRKQAKNAFAKKRKEVSDRIEEQLRKIITDRSGGRAASIQTRIDNEAGIMDAQRLANQALQNLGIKPGAGAVTANTIYKAFATDKGADAVGEEPSGAEGEEGLVPGPEGEPESAADGESYDMDAIIADRGADDLAPLIKSIYEQESSSGKAKNLDQENYAGAKGPMQVTRDTFQNMKDAGMLPEDYSFDNVSHLAEAGVVLIQDLARRYGNDPEKIAAAYYGGPSAVTEGGIRRNRRDPKNPKAPSVGEYADQVLARLMPTAEATQMARGGAVYDPSEQALLKKYDRGGSVSRPTLPADRYAGYKEDGDEEGKLKRFFEAAIRELPTAIKQNVTSNADLAAKYLKFKFGAMSPDEAVMVAKALPEGLKQTAAAVIQTAKEAPRAAAEATPESAGRFAGQMLAGEITDPLKLVRGVPKPVMQELDVYHGTPHRFPATEVNPLGEFDASKIGTGEGAQAYGHGVYYAESPDVAKTYQYQKKRMGAFATASGEGITVGGKPLDSYGIIVQPEFVDAAKTGNLVEAINGRKNQLLDFVKQQEAEIQSKQAKFATQKKPPKPHELAAIERQKLMIEGFAKKELKSLDRIIKDAQKGGVSYEGGASLYKADLPDEMIDRMLDWDKPLSQQSDYVKKVFGYTEPELPKDLKAVETGQKNPAWKYQVEGFPAAPTEEKAISNALDTIRSSQRFMGERGEKLYQKIAEKFVSAKNPLGYREASEELLRRGIPGIKYLDAGSRGQGGKGTRNFVVFPGEEKKVRILERK